MKTLSQVNRRLVRLGWLAKGKAESSRVVRSLKKYQRWAGLKADGMAGPVTRHSLAAPRICGTPDVMAARMCKWPMKRVTWTIGASLPGIPDGDFKQAAAWATRQWSDSCGIMLDYKENDRTANILMNVANLGGPGGVLADSQLPCGANRQSQMRQRYDSEEVWYAGGGTPPQGRISLRAVCVHELGHAIGISHLSPDGPRAIMQPYYRPDLLALLGPDVEQGKNRYGKSRVTPPRPPAVGDVWTVSGTFTSTTEPMVVKLDG